MSEQHLDGAFRVAVVQRPPVLLDRDATLQPALAGLDEAVGSGARLVVFPEAYVPGYPEYIWRMRPGDDTQYQLAKDIDSRLIEQAIDLEADDLRALRDAAKRHGVLVTQN